MRKMTSIIPALLVLAASHASAAEQVLAQSVRVLDGQRFTFTKFTDAKGNVRSEIHDAAGKRVQEASLPTAKRSLLATNVQDALKAAADDKPLKVNIALHLPARSSSTNVSAGSEFLGGRQQRVEINGVAGAVQDWQKHEAAMLVQEEQARRAVTEVRGNKIQAFALRHGLQKHAAVELATQQASNNLTLTLSAAELKRIIARGDADIAGIELYYEPKDTSLASAMTATGIDTGALPNTSTRGGTVGIYMTESGCADPSRVTNYTRLAGSETDHSRNVSAIVRTVSPASYLYCRGGPALPLASELGGVGGNAPIHIITRSNGGNASATYDTTDRDWDDFVYNNNIAIFNAAGNEGDASGYIITPAKGFNIISVGSYNDATSAVSTFSSYVNPEIKAQKPEIVAPGENIDAGGFTMSGTSMATPHAAAFSADMMSGISALKYRPYLLKSFLLAGGTDVISGGVDKVGLGGVDFNSAYYNGYLWYYTGNNASFSYFDAGDGVSDGYIEKKMYIGSVGGNARAVLAWATRGSYTYDHKGDAHALGMDLDLSVYDPNGNYVGGSASFDNAYESVNFTPTMVGNYSFKIKRYSNSDTASDLRIGLSLNLY
jgi:hypothetical protein